MNPLEQEIHRLRSVMLQSQMPNGSWNFCFESGILSDAYMIILLRSLGLSEEDLINRLSERIRSRQEKNGSWRLFHDEKEGDLSATIDAYFALLYGGKYSVSEPSMVAARKFIVAKGGIEKANLLTRVMLAMTGQYSWSNFFHIPVETILLPRDFPVNFFDFAGFARVHIAPILICSDRNFFLKNSRTPDLSHLYVRNPYELEEISYRQNPLYSQFLSVFNLIHEGIRTIVGLPHQIHQMALHRLEKYMLERIEPDGTLYSYFTATCFMVFALRALGYPVDHPVIQRGVQGLKTLVCRVDADHIHLQNCTSTVWDTALISYALQEGGISPTHPAIVKAGKYLMKRQQKRVGDWKVHASKGMPGGWGFSDSNTLNPDVDDTTAALRAIYPYRMGKQGPAYSTTWKKGVSWVLAMQNSDGGWPAFEVNTDKIYLTWLPYQGMEGFSTDPSTADLTGRTLEFLGRKTHLHLKDNTPLQRGLRWLFRNQEKNGSWYGRWGVCYIYGTWAALTGLMAVGVPSYAPAIQRAARWLVSIQNEDGGWGESCRSDVEKKYIPLRSSTLSQTAWAVDALISVQKKKGEEKYQKSILRGVHFLLKNGQRREWMDTYPTGAGLPGLFYTHYHSYRYIWPLLALSHFHSSGG